MAAILCYLYTFDYGYDEAMQTVELSPVAFDVHINVIADKYDIPALVELAETKFAKHAKTDWQTPGFADAIHDVYTMALDRNGSLRRTVIDVCLEHSTMLYNGELGTEFRQVAESVPSFTSAFAESMVLRLKADDEATEPEMQCFNCDCTFTTTITINGQLDHLVRHCPNCGSVVSDEIY